MDADLTFDQLKAANPQYMIFFACGLNPSGESNSEMTRTGGLGLWRMGRRLTAEKQL